MKSPESLMSTLNNRASHISVLVLKLVKKLERLRKTIRSSVISYLRSSLKHKINVTGLMLSKFD